MNKPVHMRKKKTPSETETISTREVGPPDANPYYHLHGGVLLHWMDATGGICAQRHCECHVVTVTVSNVFFKKPIRIGDIVIINAKVTRAFNTSVEVKVEAFVESIKTRELELATSAYFVYVALDASGNKVVVPEVVPQTEEEKIEYEEALKRREFNLAQERSDEKHYNK